MEGPGSTPTDSTPREGESRPGNGAVESRSSGHLNVVDHQANATPIEWRRSHRRLWSPCQAPHCPQREGGPGTPQGGAGGAGRAERRITPGRGSTTVPIRKAQRPERSEGLANPTNPPPSDRSPTMPGVLAAEGAAGAAGADQKADHTSLGVYLASQARASGNPISSSSSAKSAISPATSRVVPCSFKALSVFWIDRMQPRIRECG